LLADTVSLLPGTLSSGFEGDTLVLHVLDCRLPVLEDVRRVEDRIAKALGLTLGSSADASGDEERGDV
jgi:multisubunit Na+/H+ antiporter MnhE subunit